MRYVSLYAGGNTEVKKTARSHRWVAFPICLFLPPSLIRHSVSAVSFYFPILPLSSQLRMARFWGEKNILKSSRNDFDIYFTNNWSFKN